VKGGVAPMLKAVVFDDEYIVLQGLKTMIDWPKYGIELVGTAEDGQAALELFLRERPDIILTDIRMPGINGLELIESVMKQEPDTVCIVFSGFNEYEYVKRAIHLGVADYLEKPINIAQIEEAVRKSVERIRRQNELLEKATIDLILRGAETELKWRECLGHAAEHIEGVTVLSFTGEDMTLPSYESCRAIPVKNGAENLILLLHYASPAKKLWQELSEWAAGSSNSYGIGRTYTQAANAIRSYKEAMSALRYGRFLEEKWTYYEDLGDLSALPEGLSDHGEAILFYLRIGERTSINQHVDRFLNELYYGKEVAEIAAFKVLNLVYLSWEMVKSLGGGVPEVWKQGYLPHVELREMKTKHELNRWINNEMDKILNWMVELRQLKKRHPSVEKALSFISEQYHRELTLQEVAKQADMNPTYFSVLFKEEMNLTYIKYLTQLRMERAKELLLRDMLIQEVSEKVGYFHCRHFSEVFKKCTGRTPGQFREEHKGKGKPDRGESLR
jgi:two-component system, response regulator YesN